jgi:thiamine-phosphate pyrophosphorylase
MVDLPPRQAAHRHAVKLPAAGLAQALIAGGARVLQLRMKGASASEMLAVLDELKALVRDQPEVLLIVNDRLDVALCGGAHGAHLGQTDLPLAAARRICPPGFLLGISTHDEAQAEAAMRGGADYIALGPIFATTSKARPDPVVGLSRLRAVCQHAMVPVVAIGGITVERAADVAACGARAAAIISGVNHAPDITEAARAVSRAFGIIVG